MIFTEAAIAEALSHKCGLCNAVPDQPCANLATGEGLPDRMVHFYRLGAK